MKNKGPKNAKTAALVERVNIYLRENPETTLEIAAKILDVKATRIRKWKQFGWLVEHRGHREKARQKRSARELASQAQGLPVRDELSQDTRKTSPRPVKGKENLSGEVVPPASPKNESFEDLLERGKTMKTSELRAMIKGYMLVSLNDPKAISNYATALKSLAGVQDVELDDLYENEQMIQIYYPEERKAPKVMPETDVGSD